MQSKNEMNNKNWKESIELESQWIVYGRLFFLHLKWLIYLTVYLLKQILLGFGLFKFTSEKDIKGQLALVTGAANGIGRALSTEIAKKQCNLVLVDIDEENGEQLAKELHNLYKIKVKFYKVDISLYEEVEKLKVNVEKDLGFVDILVNNAGIIPNVQTLNPKRKPEDISKLIDVNLKAHIWTVKLFLPGMQERRRGHIVATCSLGGLMASAYILDYVSSKCAVRYFMDSLHLELLIKGNSDIIKTSVIYPTLVLTSNSVIKTIRETKGNRFMHPWSPERAGRVALSGVLKNQRYIILPTIYKFISYLNLMPDDAGRQYFKDLLQIEQSGFIHETKEII